MSLQPPPHGSTRRSDSSKSSIFLNGVTAQALVPRFDHAYAAKRSGDLPVQHVSSEEDMATLDRRYRKCPQAV